MGMNIERVTVNRTITEDEFLRLKALKPFSTFRQDSKAINFGLIFGMSFKKFSASTLETKWDFKRVTEFIRERDLNSIVNEMSQKYPNIDQKLWSYYAVAKFIRDQFFDTYKGLMKRIKRNEKLGKDVGYVRSYHGGIRRVPLLTLATNEEGKWRADESFKEMANLVNITANSTIQTDEIAVVAQSMLAWADENNEYIQYAPESGTVHDSIDFYVDKDHALEIFEKMQEVFQHNDKWQNGVMLLCDITIVDLENLDQYYKHGIDYEKFLEEHKDAKV
jgi:DNA polymerase I-like protein with 3'-5' exonuclease and polymerase domains